MGVDRVAGEDTTTEMLTLARAMAENTANAARTDLPVVRVGIACGFTPVHASILLAAYCGRRPDERRIEIVEGLYGDVAVAATGLAEQDLAGAVVVLEWADLDPRLALRGAGAGGGDLDDIVATARARADRIVAAVGVLAERVPVAVTPPMLAQPPALGARPGQQSPTEARLRAIVAEIVATLVGLPRVRVVTDRSRAAERGDARSDFRQGAPWTTAQTSAVMSDVAALLFPLPPKKGLITDLDDTLWRGLIGEVGAAAVNWDLDAGSQVHAVYQRLLSTLSGEGVLLAVSSKNDSEPAAAGLARPDLLLDSSRFFPVVADWGPKSAAVAEILRTWNVGAGDVVVVDDNPRELAEIAAAHPDITTVEFPTKDPVRALAAFDRLRSLFWRDERSTEDTLRADSIRAGAQLAAERDTASDEAGFLRGLQATLTVELGPQPAASRSFELVNKTNQFNLNGRRHDAGSWNAAGSRPGAVTATVSYDDRFGSLGAISVLLGQLNDGVLTVDTWVLSCRAFSRRIEEHTLAALAETLGVTAIDFAYAATDRNALVAGFLDSSGSTGPSHRIHPDRIATDHLHRVSVVRLDETPAETT